MGSASVNVTESATSISNNTNVSVSSPEITFKCANKSSNSYSLFGNTRAISNQLVQVGGTGYSSSKAETVAATLTASQVIINPTTTINNTLTLNSNLFTVGKGATEQFKILHTSKASNVSLTNTNVSITSNNIISSAVKDNTSVTNILNGTDAVATWEFKTPINSTSSTSSTSATTAVNK